MLGHVGEKSTPFSFACTPRAPAWACCHPPGKLLVFDLCLVDKIDSYLFLLGLVLIIVVLAVIVLVILIIVVEIGIVLLVQLLESEGLAGEPVDGAGNKLLLDVLTELVVELETLLNILGRLVVVVGGGLGGREEVEEGLGWDSLLNDASLLRGWFVLEKTPILHEFSPSTYSCYVASSVRCER